MLKALMYHRAVAADSFLGKKDGVAYTNVKNWSEFSKNLAWWSNPKFNMYPVLRGKPRELLSYLRSNPETAARLLVRVPAGNAEPGDGDDAAQLHLLCLKKDKDGDYAINIHDEFALPDTE